MLLELSCRRKTAPRQPQLCAGLRQVHRETSPEPQFPRLQMRRMTTPASALLKAEGVVYREHLAQCPAQPDAPHSIRDCSSNIRSQPRRRQGEGRSWTGRVRSFRV